MFKKSVHTFIVAGDAARDKRSWLDAGEQYQRALDIDPSNDAIWVQLGHSLKESGDLTSAENAYRRALNLDDKNADTYLQLGHVLKLQGRISEATSSYLSSLKLDPKSGFPTHELKQLGWRPQDYIQFLSDEQKNVEQLHKINSVQPDQINLIAPVGYQDAFFDVDALVRMGIVSSSDQHYSHYGVFQGRKIIQSLKELPPKTAFILCPSFHKRCGIGEHARYLSDCIERSGLKTYRIRTTTELESVSETEIRDAVVIVNHGPGLFDGYNPQLSEGESVTDLISILNALFENVNLRPIILMHSLLDRDNEIMFPRQQFIIRSGIPVATTVQSAAKFFNLIHVEHGMQPLDVPQRTNKSSTDRNYPKLGFFGFFQWGGKNFDALFNAAQKLKAKLVGSVATGGDDQKRYLEEKLSSLQIECDLGTGWVDDQTLVDRLSEADFYYLPQHDYDHWNNSGTARLVMNFQKPVLLPAYNPFLDLKEYAIFVDDDDLPAVVSHLRNENNYNKACKRSENYCNAHPMTETMTEMALQLPKLINKSGIQNFIDSNMLSTYHLIRLSREQIDARLHQAGWHTGEQKQFLEKDLSVQSYLNKLYLDDSYKNAVIFPIVQEITYWRTHYEIEDLLFFTSHDVFVNAYRCILKRDPTLPDREFAKSVLNVRTIGSGVTSTDNSIQLVQSLLTRKIDVDFSPNVQLYHKGAPLNPYKLSDTELVKDLSVAWKRRNEFCVDLQNKRLSNFTDKHQRNLFSILMMSDCALCDRLNDISITSIGRRCFNDQLGESALWEKYMIIAKTLAMNSIRATELFILDAPVAMPVDVDRSCYEASELWCFDGDEFIINAVRCLLKRNPTAWEMFDLGEVIQNGKLQVLQAISKNPFKNAFVHEIDHILPIHLDSKYADLQQLIKQFRSAHAGGWDSRNEYLENRRNLNRLWIKLKSQKDVIWQQSNQNISRISG